MTRIHLFLCTLAALFLAPAAALAAEGVEPAPGVAQLAGVIAMVVAIAGVTTRLLTKAAPLYRLLPERFRWIPDALLATGGTLLVGLPTAGGSWLEFIELCLLSVLLGVIAAAPGVHPTDQK